MTQEVAGLALLLFGAWLAVRSASNLAALLGLSPVVIGATVVAFGTSAPEFLVSTLAATRGSSELAFGNAVGSNITNVALILGLSAIIVPLQINTRLFRWEMPVLLAATLVFMLFMANGTLGRVEGAAMFLALVVFVVLSFRLWPEAAVEAAGQGTDVEVPRDARAALAQSGLVVLGIAALAIGAESLVRGAVTMAETAGLSELRDWRDRRRDRHEHAGARDERGGGLEEGRRYRGGERRRLQHLQPPRRARPGGGDRPD